MVVLLMLCLVWLGRMPRTSRPASEGLLPVLASSAPSTVIRLGIVPERDIFAQRRRYRALADHLETELRRPVELVTASSYRQILDDFKAERVDAAFLGSFVAVLAMDRYDARVLARPEDSAGRSTYRGVVVVEPGSPVTSVEQLARKRIAMVRTTTGGHLFPMMILRDAKLLDTPDAPQIVWVGTHDDAITEVLSRRVDAAALKDIRLDAYEAAHPGTRFRRIATSAAVPDNALLVRRGLADELGPLLAAALARMDETESGRATLNGFGAARFISSSRVEYVAVYDIIDRLGTHWLAAGFTGPMPTRPQDLPPRTSTPATKGEVP